MHGLALGRHHNAWQVVAASRRPAPAEPLFRIDSETDRRVAVVHPFLLSRLRVPCSSASGKGRCRVCVLCNYQHTPIRINMGDGRGTVRRARVACGFLQVFPFFSG